MSENKEKEIREQTPKTNVGASPVKSSNAVRASGSQASGWKKWMGKKWVFPATYVTAAAIILALMWVIQDSGANDLNTDLSINPDEQNEATDLAGDSAVPVGGVAEEMQWPANQSEVKVNMPFYEAGASGEDKQAAIIEQGNKFMPNMGISLAREDDKPFAVLAAMSGEVTRSENVPSVGRLVEITHEGGLATIYYSLASTTVASGDEVKQGDIIGQAGRNEIEKSLGVHLHFEVHKSGEPVNPETFIAQETQSGTEPEAGSETETETEPATESGIQSETGSETSSETGSETSSEAGSESGTETSSETESQLQSE